MSHEVIILALTAFCGIFLSWGVGANDFSNILSPAIGSRAVNVRQIVVIALIFELLGALLGGDKIAATVQNGIINTDLLVNTPQILVYGMLAALLASSVWIATASHFGIPVSLTNAIIGSIVGFGMLVLGWHAIHWRSIGNIGLSWIICPCAASVVAYLIFNITQKIILSTVAPLDKAKKYLPFYLFIVGFILSEITVIKALKHFSIQLHPVENILIATACGIAIVISGNILLKKIYNQPYVNYKEQFVLVEKAFAFLMIFTSCAMVYAHGANDIATATGPVITILHYVLSGSVDHNNNLLLVILTCGYVGVAIGFLTFGRKVIETVGSAITELTPIRAFCATFAAATTVVTSTSLGLPVSATQTLVGAILGVGLARGIGAIDLRIVRNIFMSWFITIPITGVLTAIFFYGFKGMFS